jgi:hypothetical protein
VIKSWGDQIRARHRLRLDPLPFGASALIVFATLLYLRVLWLLRNLEWDTGQYLVVMIPGFALSLAANVMRTDTSERAATPVAQFRANSRPVFLLLSTFPLTMAAIPHVTDIRRVLEDPPNLVFVTTVRLVLFGGALALAFAKSERTLRVAIGVAWGLIAILILVIATPNWGSI